MTPGSRSAPRGAGPVRSGLHCSFPWLGQRRGHRAVKVQVRRADATLLTPWSGHRIVALVVRTVGAARADPDWDEPR